MVVSLPSNGKKEITKNEDVTSLKISSLIVKRSVASYLVLLILASKGLDVA